MHRIRTTYLPILLTTLSLVFVCALPFLVSANDIPASSITAITDSPHTGKSGAPTPTDVTPGVGSLVGSTIGNIILSIGSLVTGFGGSLLEASIQLLILDTGKLLSNSQPLGIAIQNIWILIRDICNLAFIFGFIYAGIRLIIDADSGHAKRMVASIIIGALLINFSLFFAKLVIDVSNYLSVEIYANLVDTSTGASSISGKFREAMGLSTIYNVGDVKEFASRTVMGNLAFYFMATLILIIAGFVFAAGAIFLIIRFVALILILCFSPVLFAATVFPATEQQAKTLWSKLINYSFFAPVYLLLLIVSLRVVEAVRATMTGSNTMMASAIQGINTGVTDTFGIFISFGIAIFFLIMSLNIASKFGIFASDKVIGFGNTMRKKVQGGITSYVGRNTVGAASKWALKKYDKYDAKMANSKTMQNIKSTRLGRIGLKTAKGAAFVGTLGLAGGVINDRNVRDTLEAGKKSKFGGSYSREDDLAYEAGLKKRRAAEAKKAQFEADIALGTKELLAKDPKDLTEKEKEEKTKLERAIAEASTKQLEDLEHEQRLALVEFMTQSQIDALGKSDELSEKEKEELSAARSDIFKKKYGASQEGEASQKLRDNLPKANIDQLSAMGVDFLREENHAVRLTNSQMDDLKKKLTPTEYARVDDARKAALKKLAEDGATIDGKTAQNHILKMKASDMSKLPREVLIALAPSLPTATLIEIAKQNTLNSEDQRTIREEIMTVIDEYTRGLHRVSPEDQRQLEAVNEFLDNNPYGKQFGR